MDLCKKWERQFDLRWAAKWFEFRQMVNSGFGDVSVASADINPDPRIGWRSKFE